jgi:hypothetical protein
MEAESGLTAARASVENPCPLATHNSEKIGSAMRARIGLTVLLLLAAVPFARAQDLSYALTPAAAEKFVRATQQLVANRAAPNAQGVNPANLATVKAALDANPAAQQALTAAGLTSAEYVSFMGAAMAAMMVGQMELAGVRGMLPPGIATRPSQQNIDFMKANADLFQRSMQPGASATATAAPLNAAAPTANDEALPMPASAGAVLPSSILARLPRLDAIKRGTDCTLGNLQTTIEKETAQAVALQDAYYGNPGDSGLKRTAAEGAILDRLEDTDLESCGISLMNDAAYAAESTAAYDAFREASGRISEEQQAAWNACPGISGGKDPACERRVEADAARKRHEAQRQFLARMSPPFAARIATLRTCTVKRESLVADAKAANVRGANVKLVLRPLVLAWQQAPFLPAEWSSICDSAQQSLLE